MVVRWDNPKVVEETRKMAKDWAEELAKQGMYKIVEKEYDTHLRKA